MKIVLSVAMVLFLLGSSAFAKSEKCSVGSTQGIVYRFDKTVGEKVFIPASGPLEGAVVAFYIDKKKAFKMKPRPGVVEQVGIYKKDYYAIRLALFSKNEFVDVRASNGVLADSYLTIPSIDQPFHLVTVETKLPDFQSRELWLHCD